MRVMRFSRFSGDRISGKVQLVGDRVGLLDSVVTKERQRVRQDKASVLKVNCLKIMHGVGFKHVKLWGRLQTPPRLHTNVGFFLFLPSARMPSA
ncbi:MAG: hypothetical protein PUP92_38760 [Rhizonema sp. PD38]|nr:hypothetical protein [Rhizonema sp. PD38]